jgi:hypothetical protein
MDRTGTDKLNITSKHHTILLHAFIHGHAQARTGAGAYTYYYFMHLASSCYCPFSMAGAFSDVVYIDLIHFLR